MDQPPPMPRLNDLVNEECPELELGCSKWDLVC